MSHKPTLCGKETQTQPPWMLGFGFSGSWLIESPSSNNQCKAGGFRAAPVSWPHWPETFMLRWNMVEEQDGGVTLHTHAIHEALRD